MEETKPWWQSKTIWASIAQVIVGIAVSAGLFTEAQGTEIISQAPELVIGVITSALGLIVFWARFTSTKQVTMSTSSTPK